MNLTFMQGLFAGVIPYLPADIVKIILALIFAPQIRKRVKMSL
jgi:biotin transport system substrate-specific component